MKYIYYIVGILIIITIGMVFQLSKLEVEVSKPVIVINDRIISEDELRALKKYGSYHTRGEGFIDSVITRELLIQEAIRQGINQEEAFRKSVENFYEQSLVKIIVDRKYDSLTPTVSEAQVERYKKYTGKKITYTKFRYASEKDLQKEKPSSSEIFKKEFESLSDRLKYTLMTLNPGQMSSPFPSEKGFVAYRLEHTSSSPGAESVSETRIVKEFLVEQYKRISFDKWLDKLKSRADIQVSASGDDE